ncbi:MAG: hypothetical protein ACRDA3_14175 [Peptostreptococcaceae bacterium]
MNKLLTLVNLELKRHMKFCTIYILTFFVLVFGINIFTILRIYQNTPYISSLIDKYGGITYGSEILSGNIYIFGAIVIGLVGGLLIYTVMIWKSDYSDKSIYTFIMLPQNRFYIYLAKLISVLVIVYSYLISNIIAIFLSKNIFSLAFKNKGLIKTLLSSDFNYSGFGKIIFPINFIDFIMIYGVWLLLVISILFVVCIIGLSFKNSLKLTLFILLMYPIVNIFLLLIYSDKTYEILNVYSIGNIGLDLILNLVNIVILNSISYVLINKRIYI